MRKLRSEVVDLSLPDAKKAAKKLFSAKFITKKVRLDSLEITNRGFYSSCLKKLERLKFTWLIDYKVTSLPKGSSGYNTPVRVFLSEDFKTYCSVYSLQLNPQEKKERREIGFPTSINTIDLTSVSKNGSQLVTTNAEEIRPQSHPKKIAMTIFDAKTGIEVLVKKHFETVKKNANKYSDIKSWKDVVRSEVAGQRIKEEFKKNAGWVTKRELTRQQSEMMGRDSKFTKNLKNLDAEIENLELLQKQFLESIFSGLKRVTKLSKQ